MTKSAIDLFKIYREVFEYYYVQKLPTTLVCQKIEEKLPELKPFGKNKLMGLTFRFRKLLKLPIPTGYIGNLRIVLTPESEEFIKWAFSQSHDLTKLSIYAETIKVNSTCVRVGYKLRDNQQKPKSSTVKSSVFVESMGLDFVSIDHVGLIKNEDPLLSVDKEDLTQTKQPIYKTGYRRAKTAVILKEGVATGVAIYAAKMQRQPPVLPAKYGQDDDLSLFPNHVLNLEVVGCRRILTSNNTLYACNTPLKESARKMFCSSCLSLFTEKSRRVIEE